MDIIDETPPKRRKTDNGAESVPHAYDSQDDSGDDLFAHHDTIATMPWAGQYTTQPTQLLPQSHANTQNLAHLTSKPDLPPAEIVQVAASSPARATSPRPAVCAAVQTSRPSLAQSMAPPGTAFRPPHGISMAPAGTAFRPPPGVQRPPPGATIDRPLQPDSDSDEDGGMKYQGHSSDEDTQYQRRQIKPSVITSRKPISGYGAEKQQPGQGPSSFRQIVSAFKAPPTSLNRSSSTQNSQTSQETSQTIPIFSPAPQRSADPLANAYGSVRRAAILPGRQTKPSKALPVDVRLEDIPDFDLRRKVTNMLNVLPGHRIQVLWDAIIRHKGSESDAMDDLVNRTTTDDSKFVDLTKEGDEDELQQPTLERKKPSAKQQLKAPTRTIQEKYGRSTGAKDAISSPPLTSTMQPTKPRRKLVQGRKNASSPVRDDDFSDAPPKRSETPISLADTDSGIASEPEDRSFDGDLVHFFNTCSIADLCDLASIDDQLAALVVAKRPFRTVQQIRAIEDDRVSKERKARRGGVRRAAGERIVDVSEKMWAGYAAVDRLVQTCKDLGKPVADAMRNWGVDIFGSAGEGEVDLTSFDDSDKTDHSLRDSGIGTPTSTSPSVHDDDGDVKRPSAAIRAAKLGIFPQPSLMPDSVILKDYQVVGINWLALLFRQKLSCILADDMGLGKTCQVIGFLAHLKEMGIPGPHIVVVPGSTLENWLREFNTFCPALNVRPYYADQKRREGLQETIIEESPDVVITTYDLAKVLNDRKFLRSLKPTVCVYDEGHQLKNSKSKAYEQLMKIHPKFRLLLTGTPLQNNLSELASLLGFILPDVFQENREELEAVFSHRAKTSDETHEALLSAQRIARARSMMTPFILRRKKHQVLKHLPVKTRRVIECELSPAQERLYQEHRARHRRMWEARESGAKSNKESTNILMALRKAAIHPLLERSLYDDSRLIEMAKAYVTLPEYTDRNVDFCYEDMTVMNDWELHRMCANEENAPALTPFALPGTPWMDSGKVSALCDLLRGFRVAGDRVLIFSQFTQVMDILERVLETIDVPFFRLDGSTRIEERQSLLDEFHADDSVTAFMLSTRAGGAGINLACANKVVIFDASFNPQDDIQAENRAHRVGQTRPVEVVRLVTRNTIEEQIHALGTSKIALDDRVSGGDAAAPTEAAGSSASASAADKAQQVGLEQVRRMLGEEVEGKDKPSL